MKRRYAHLERMIYDEDHTWTPSRQSAQSAGSKVVQLAGEERVTRPDPLPGLPRVENYRKPQSHIEASEEENNLPTLKGGVMPEKHTSEPPPEQQPKTAEFYDTQDRVYVYALSFGAVAVNADWGPVE